MKPTPGMAVILAILTATAKTLAFQEHPPGVPQETARDIVEGLASWAKGLPKGSLNLRFAFDSSASKNEKLMWQTLVVELFFAEYANRIRIDVPIAGVKKGDQMWVDASNLEAINTILKQALDSEIDVAIYATEKPGEFRLAAVKS